MPYEIGTYINEVLSLGGFFIQNVVLGLFGLKYNYTFGAGGEVMLTRFLRRPSIISKKKYYRFHYVL